MFKRSPAPFVPPIPPDATSSSESSPNFRQQQLAPDQTGATAAIGALGRPQLPHHASLTGLPPGSPGVYAHFAGPEDMQDYQDMTNVNMNMMMMQRWQQQQGRRQSAQGAAVLRSPGPPAKDPVSAGGRSMYGGGAAAAQLAYAAAAANAAQTPGAYGYGFSPYPQPSPYPYQPGAFPFGAGMYGQPAAAAAYASPYMTPMPTTAMLDPMGGGMGAGGAPRPTAMGGGGMGGMGAIVPSGGGGSLIGRPGQAQEIPVTGKWLPGPEYAPALDTLLYSIVQPPSIELHPLLRPISETRDSADPFLVFDILFPPNTIHLSTEPPRKSWSKGRKDPATFPRLKVIRLINQFTPWVIQVSTDSDAGVTVSDVINAVHEHFRINASQDDDWNSCDQGSQSEILMAYKWNRSTEMGAPGGIMPDALLRGDFLMERTMFAGIRRAEPDLCEQKMQVKNFPATFELMLHTR